MNSDIMGVREAAQLLNARFISFSNNARFSSVSVDSRNVKKDGLFFALAGAVCDGHAFVDAAFKAGAAAAVVDASKIKSFNLIETAKNAGRDLIAVPNVLIALQESARIYLEKFPELLKIGITGSSGKTTTKEIAASIISMEKNTVMNKGNYNSDIGLALSVFDVRDCHEAGIFEIGISNPGEMICLAEILKPNIALITNIGTAHIGNFGSKIEILNEKKLIYSFLKENDIALVPKNDEYSSELAQGVTGNVRFYGADTFKELGAVRSLGLEGTEITWAGEKVRFALPGKHSLDDALAAIAIAKAAGVGDDAVRGGLESVKPLFGRLEILKGRTTAIRDCYNANPDSTAKSIEFCDSLDWQGRRVYVIADMLELGDSSAAAHENLGSILAKSNADKVFLFGTETKVSAEKMRGGIKPFYYTADMDELSNAIDCYVQTGDLVLLKGSRGCALERLSDMLVGGRDVS